MGESECPSCTIFSCLKKKLGDEDFINELMRKVAKKEISPKEAADKIIEKYGREKVLEALRQCTTKK